MYCMCCSHSSAIGILVHGSFQGGGIQNYVDILTKYHIQTYFINSLIISVSVVVLVVFLDVLAGFALSKLNFPFKNGVYIFLLSGAASSCSCHPGSGFSDKFKVGHIEYLSGSDGALCGADSSI